MATQQTIVFIQISSFLHISCFVYQSKLHEVASFSISCYIFDIKICFSSLVCALGQIQFQDFPLVYSHFFGCSILALVPVTLTFFMENLLLGRAISLLALKPILYIGLKFSFKVFASFARLYMSLDRRGDEKTVELISH